MKTLKLVPVNTSIGFIRHRTIAMVLSSLFVLLPCLCFWPMA